VKVRGDPIRRVARGNLGALLHHTDYHSTATIDENALGNGIDNRESFLNHFPWPKVMQTSTCHR
jgi:hypothetical protein